MTELSPEARGLVEESRSLEDPSDAARERGRARLTQRLGAATMAAALPSVATTQAAAVSGAASLIKSALVWGLFGAALGLGTFAAVDTVERMTSKPAQPAATVPHATPPSRAWVPSASPREPEPRAEEPPPRALPSRQAETPRPAASSSLAEELDLIRRAEEALRAGEPARALGFLNEHARRFPKGELSEERNGAEVIAACALRERGATERAEKFLASRGASPLAARIRTACGL